MRSELDGGSQVNEQLSHVTPEIERYYEYHRELYDFTFGKTKDSSRRLLETGSLLAPLDELLATG